MTAKPPVPEEGQPTPQTAEHPGQTGELAQQPKPAQPSEQPKPRGLSRRTALGAVWGGAAGLALGAGGMFGGQWWRDRSDTSAPAAKPDPSPPASKRAAARGAVPEPLWHRTFTGQDRAVTGPTAWLDKALLLPTRKGLLGLDPRTGRELWSQDKVTAPDELYVTDDGIVLALSGTTELVGLNAASGKVSWRESAYHRDAADDGDAPTYQRVLGVRKAHAYLLLTRAKDGAERGRGGEDPGEDEDHTNTADAVVVAYDTAKRREAWRTPIPTRVLQTLKGGEVFTLTDRHLLYAEGTNRDQFQEFLDSPDPLEAAKKAAKLTFTALDLRDGKKRWRRELRDVPGYFSFDVSPAGRALLSFEGELRGYDLLRDRQLWSAQAPPGTVFGRGSQDEKKAYVSDDAKGVQVLDASSGQQLWYRSGMPLADVDGTPATWPSDSGDTVFTADDTEVAAYDVQKGRLLWRLADSARDWDGPDGTGRWTATAEGVLVLLKGQDLYAFPVS